MRKLTDIISEGFIWGVGITRPEDRHRRRAAWFISLTLAATILGVIAVFFFLVSRFSR